MLCYLKFKFVFSLYYIVSFFSKQRCQKRFIKFNSTVLFSTTLLLTTCVGTFLQLILDCIILGHKFLNSYNHRLWANSNNVLRIIIEMQLFSIILFSNCFINSVNINFQSLVRSGKKVMYRGVIPILQHKKRHSQILQYF